MVLKLSEKIIYSHPTIKEKEEMYRLRMQVFAKYGYLNGNDERDFDKFDPQSVHFIAQDSNVIIGTIRLIKYIDGFRFPIEMNFELSEMPFENVSKSSVVEISRLAVKEDASDKRKILLGLIKSIYDYSTKNGTYHWYLAADNKVFRLLSRFGFAFTIIGEPSIYLGSLTIPAYIEIRAGMQYLKEVNPEIYKFFANEPVDGFDWYQFREQEG